MEQQPPPTSNSRVLLKRLVFGRNPRRTVTRALLVVAASFFLFKFVLLPIRITGSSMEPTYRDRSINFVNRLSYLWRKPNRGDVVAVKTSGVHISI